MNKSMIKHKGWNSVKNFFRKKEDFGSEDNYDQDALQTEQKILKKKRPPRPPPPSQNYLIKFQEKSRVNRTSSLPNKKTNTSFSITPKQRISPNGSIGSKSTNFTYNQEIDDKHSEEIEDLDKANNNVTAKENEDNCVYTPNREENSPSIMFSIPITGSLNNINGNTNLFSHGTKDAPPKPPRVKKDNNVYQSLPQLHTIENFNFEKKIEISARRMQQSSNNERGCLQRAPPMRTVSNSYEEQKITLYRSKESVSSDLAVDKYTDLLPEEKISTDKDKRTAMVEKGRSLNSKILPTVQENKLSNLNKRKKKIAPRIENQREAKLSQLKISTSKLINQNPILSKHKENDINEVTALPEKEDRRSIFYVEKPDEDIKDEKLLECDYFEKLAVIENALEKVELRSEICYFEDDYYILCDQLSEMSMRVDRIRVYGEALVARKKTILKRIQLLEKVLDKKFIYLH